MKIFWQALICSLSIHVIYFFTTFVIGYIKTKHYQPEMSEQWGNVHTLSNKVTFGYTISPYFFLSTIIGLALICGACIYFFRK